jgi:hypothetical protein
MIGAYVFALAAGVLSGRENHLHVPAPGTVHATLANRDRDPGGRLNRDLPESGSMTAGRLSYQPTPVTIVFRRLQQPPDGTGRSAIR